ncbi:MAG: hypothetical protein PVG71_16420 [Anaerolineae bacterium]|jgi:hypothetical protein
MGRPDNPEDYVGFEVGDGVVAYLSRDVLDRQKPGTRRMRFSFTGYGVCWLEFAEPWRERGMGDHGE